MEFKVLFSSQQTKARVGEINCSHGVIQTPNFVPVGTQASVKAVPPVALQEIGVQIFFANTYHLYLRPKAEVINHLGGLHRFMGWSGPIMTDSGGFQVFSLGLGKHMGIEKDNETLVSLPEQHKGVTGEKLAEITEEGVFFKSHLDGSQHFLNPEKSMAVQTLLGSDILMAFDDCTPYPVSFEQAQSSMERTHRWAVQSVEAFQKLRSETNVNKDQNLYGVVQGSVFPELRKKSAQFISELNTPGIAIGGVSVGESKSEMIVALDNTLPYLPDEKPRHLLGVGEVDDIFNAVERGVDTLDCVIPTRWARNGTLMVSPKTAIEESAVNPYRIIILNNKYIEDSKPIDPDCDCYTCRHFSRGYLNHLYRSKEILGIYLGTYHNLYFMIHLMKEIRDSILNNTFDALKEVWLQKK